VMAAAGGASSIITQVQQTGGPPINTLGGMFDNQGHLVWFVLICCNRYWRRRTRRSRPPVGPHIDISITHSLTN
jgi:hypothetical protein